MGALYLYFQAAPGNRAEAMGRLLGFVVGFGLVLIVAIVLGMKIKKKMKK